MAFGKFKSNVKVSYETFPESEDKALKVNLQGESGFEYTTGKGDLASVVDETQSDAAEWLQEERLPLYKNITEFLINGVTGYMMMYGAASILDLEYPNHEILASFLFSTAPYFTSRVGGYIVNRWLSRPDTYLHQYGELLNRVGGTICASAIGIGLGASGAFKANDIKDSAFLATLGMFAGKTGETVCSNIKQKCEVAQPVRLNQK